MVRYVSGRGVIEFLKRVESEPEPADPVKVACALTAVLAIAIAFVWELVRVMQ